jgi:ABC-type amino acid transport substrate-binding protein
MVPALLNQDAETTLLDVPDALVALERWAGEIKVLGPISERQEMAVAFRPESLELRAAFDAYLAQVRADGSYDRLVQRYYPAVFDYFPEFFAAR